MPPKAKFTREQIISSAVQLVREAGMSALTARALSERLNCSVAPVFGFFKNMEEVQIEVVKEVKQIYREYIKAGLSQPIPFKGVGQQYIKFAVEQPKFFQLLFMTEHNVKNVNSLLPLIDDNYEEILDSVRRSYDVEGVRAEKIYKHLFIYTHGIAAICATGVYTFTNEEIAAMMTEACVSIIKHLKEKKDD